MAGDRSDASDRFRALIWQVGSKTCHPTPAPGRARGLPWIHNNWRLVENL